MGELLTSQPRLSRASFRRSWLHQSPACFPAQLSFNLSPPARSQSTTAHTPNMSDSDSSPLSSIVSTDEETLKASVKRGVGLEKYFKRAAKPPKLPKRLPPPPHEDHELTLADNPDIAVSIYIYI